MSIIHLPFDVLNLILQFDGRIKYLHKDKIYINILNKYDQRYNVLKPKVSNQIDLVNFLTLGNRLKFYVDIFYKSSEQCLIFSKKKYSFI
jgi:hypothetical protein